MSDTYSRGLLRVLSILEDYLPDIVLIGGCVPYIYWKYIFKTKVPPVYTTDLDILTSNVLPISADSIASLLGDAEYRGRVLDLNHTQYFKFESSFEPGFEVEFLTPEPAREHGETLVIQNGLRAQVLPGLDILLANSMVARIRDRLEGTAVEFDVRVPTPGAFVLNKIESYLDPYGEVDREKDIYYVFYVLRYLPTDKKAIVDGMKECAGSGGLEALTSRLRPLFSDEFSPGTRDVATQHSSRGMTESNVRLLVLSEFDEFLSLLYP